MHLPLSCSISNIGIPGCVYVGAIFSAVIITSHTTYRNSARLWSPGGEVGTVAFKLFPQSLLSYAPEFNGGIGEGSSVCRFTRVPTWWLCGPICASMTRYLVSNLHPEYSCCYRCIAVKSIWDWNRIYLFKDRTLLSSMRSVYGVLPLWLPAVCWHGKLVSDCAIRKLLGVLVWLHSDRPTLDMKNILYIWLSHFTLTETNRG